MHQHLNFRNLDSDLYWSHVGPDHERASYNLLYLVDAYQQRGGERYQACTAYGFKKRHSAPDKTYATLPAAKRAARAWVMKWLAGTGGDIEWSVADTGVHFMALADGLDIGHYYHNETPGRYHVGFRAHFGMTFYDERHVSTPDQAKAAITETWATWLVNARARFTRDGICSHA